MLKIIIIGICIILVLASFLSPQIREFLNEKIQGIFFKHAKEKELIGYIELYNPRVEEIQRILKDTGISCGPIDGRMGWQTRKAIREFQEEKGLKVTGMIDSQTMLELNREKEVLSNRNKEKIEEPITFLFEEPPKDIKSKEEIQKIRGPQDEITKLGSPKDKIMQIQTALKKAGFDPGPIDGKMGKKTKNAIREFQKVKGLKVDGRVGENIWQELKKYLNE